MKKIIIVFSFIFLTCISVIAENEIYEFGPETDDLILLIAYRSADNSENNSTRVLKNLLNEINDQPLYQRIIVAIVDNDTLNLPNFVPTNEYRNTKKITHMAHGYKHVAAFILEDGKSDSVKIIAGAGKKASPPWLFQAVYKELLDKEVKIDFEASYILLYRLGLLENDTILAEYLKEDIPAIKIATNYDIKNIIKTFITANRKGLPKTWDKHYIIKKIFEFKIVSEKALIIIIINISFFALFYVFMLTFSFEQKKELHLKDLLKLWKMPVLFLFLNIISFYASEYFTSFIFSIRFGNTEAINSFPILAIILKFSLAFTLSSLFLLLNKFTKLPQNTFIYGYLTTLVCFINIFIFANFDLSFALLFLEIYILSFLSFQIKNTHSQIMFFIFNIALLLTYFTPVFSMPNNIIASLFFSNNIVAAFFFIPYELMIIRIILRMKRDKLKFQISNVHAISFLAGLSILCMLLIFITPFFLKEKKDYVVFNIDENNKTEKTNPIIKNIKAEHFFTISSAARNYLERSICDIKVKPIIKPAIISVFIESEEGFPVYESNLNFNAEADGKTVKFLSQINTMNTFRIKFSSKKNAKIKVKVIAWYEASPPSVAEKKASLKGNKFIFKVVKEFPLSPGEGD